MPENNNEVKKEIESSNIFDDFAQDSSLLQEVNKLKSENNKDKFYYISKSARFLQTIFLILFFVFAILLTYIYVQNKEDYKNSNILDPLCFVFLGNIPNQDTYCSSITSLNNTYTTKLNTLKETQTKDILAILENLYEVENFTKTKEVIFLTDKSNNKLKVLEVLEAFDNLKNNFDKIDKQKVQCNWLIIDSKDDVLSMSCTAYSAWYEKWIKWFDWVTDSSLKWTSISIANSFLNYISKTSDIFTIVDRQKVFRSESVLWEKTDFTNKTSFSLKLKYNLK